MDGDGCGCDECEEEAAEVVHIFSYDWVVVM
jgi:hypothetical protein